MGLGPRTGGVVVRACLGSCPWGVSLLLGTGGMELLGERASPMKDWVGTEVLRLVGGRGMGGLVWEVLLVLGTAAGGRSPSSPTDLSAIVAIITTH